MTSFLGSEPVTPKLRDGGIGKEICIYVNRSKNYYEQNELGIIVFDKVKIRLIKATAHLHNNTFGLL